LHIKGNGEFTGDITGSTITGSSIEVKDGSTVNFSVTDKGKLTAKEVDISGKITATEGDIGGWKVDSTCFKKYASGESFSPTFVVGDAIIQPSGTSDAYTIGGKNTSGWVLGIGPNFGVTTGGDLYATNADISGKINAEEGTIAGWTLRDTSLISGYATSGTVIGLFTNYKGLPTSSEDPTLIKEHAAIGNANKNDWRILIGNNGAFSFGVDSTGILHAKEANISGNITGSTITGSSFVIKDNNENVQFSVTNTGELTAKKGSIASWTLRDTSLISGYHGGTVMGLFTDYQGIPTTSGSAALGNTSLPVAGS
jgi:hypothetical protein